MSGRPVATLSKLMIAIKGKTILMTSRNAVGGSNKSPVSALMALSTIDHSGLTITQKPGKLRGKSEGKTRHHLVTDKSIKMKECCKCGSNS